MKDLVSSATNLGSDTGNITAGERASQLDWLRKNVPQFRAAEQDVIRSDENAARVRKLVEKAA